MSRRGGPGVQLLAVVAVAGLFIYGFYSYHDVRTRLRKTDEKADRLRQQHDSISAQLQVVYEHKTRLEKSLQSEKQDHRKTKEDSLTEKNDMDLKFTKEKQDLLSRINSINQEHKLLESRHADLQAEMAKEQEKYEKLEEDQRQISTQHQQEYNQLKQERENEAAQMRDQISDLTRNNADMQEKLRLALETAANSERQSVARQTELDQLKYSFANLQQAHQLLQQQKQQQSVQQQQQPVQQQHQPVQQQSVQQQQPVQQPSVQQQAVQQQQQQFMQAQPILQQQQKQQEYAMNQIRQHNLPDVPGQPQVWQQNLGQAPQYQQQEQMKLQQQPQQQPQQVQQQPVGDTDNQGQGKAAEEDEQVMQVPVPGGEEKKAYFEPKEAKPDGLGVRVDGAVEAQDAREEEDVNQQVAAPDLKPDEEEKKKEELLGEDEKEDADRIEPPFGVQGMAAADAQQVDRPQAPQQLEEDAEEVDMIRGAGDPQDEDERQPEKQLAGGEKMAVGGDDDGDDYMGDNADDDKVDLADHDDGLDDAAVADGDQQQDHQEQAGGVGL